MFYQIGKGITVVKFKSFSGLSKVFENLLLPFIQVPQGKKYVFIVGCYNSGTTLLDHLLGSHEEISNLPTEGTALTDQLSTPEDYGWPRMWHKCQEEIRLDENDTSVDTVRLKKQWGRIYDTTKNIFVEKSISNSARIRWFNKYFEEPYFIWIIRNGYCAAEGIRRRSRSSKTLREGFRPDGYPFALCASQWVINNEIIEEDLKGVRYSKKITYEDLTENVEDTLMELLEWLPVNKNEVPTYEEFSFHKQTRPVGNFNEESLSKLTDEDYRTFNEVGREALKRWSYPVIDG